MTRVRVVIAGRADPALPLARLRARGELVEVRAADLRFTPEEAAVSSHKNIITRAIGTRPCVKPEVQFHDALAGDVYLLCSDGLSDLVSSDDMGQALARNGTDLQRTVAELIDLANERGGKDNITVVLARVEEGVPPTKVNGNGTK